MNEDIVFIVGFFITATVISLGFPIVRSVLRMKERAQMATPPDPEREARLARMETAIESMAVEVERISEGQRFITKLLADRAQQERLPAGGERP